MSYGKYEKCCSAFKLWPRNGSICGNCGWEEDEHVATPHMTKDWKERFDKKFTAIYLVAPADVIDHHLGEVKEFVEAERKQAQEDIVESILFHCVPKSSNAPGQLTADITRSLIKEHARSLGLSLSDDKKE